MKQVSPFEKQPHMLDKTAPAASLRKQANKLGILLCLVIAAMYLFSYGSQWFLTAVGYQRTQYNEAISILNYLLNGSVSLLSMLLPAVIFIAIFQLKLPNIIVTEKAAPMLTAAVFFIGSTVCLFANFPTNWLTAILENAGLEGSSPAVPTVPTVPSYIMNALATAVAAPFAEEFLFRGVVLSQLRKYGDAFAVIASALLFALMHRNFPQILFAFICGLALGLALVKTDNIWVPVGMHTFVNGFYVAMNILRLYCSTVVYSAVFYIIILTMMLISLFIILYLLLKKRQWLHLRPGVLSAGSGMGNLFLNPGILIFTGVCVILSISRLGVF